MRDTHLKSVVAHRDSPSDETLLCVAILLTEGQSVQIGTPLFEVEGAKSIFEVEAESAGYFYPLSAVGDRIIPGDTIGIISTRLLMQTEFKELIKESKSTPTFEKESNEFLLSQPAIDLIHELKIDISQISSKLPSQGVVTKNHILEAVKGSEISNFADIYMWTEGQKSWKLWMELEAELEPCVLIGGGSSAIQSLDLVKLDGTLKPMGYMSREVENPLDFLGIPRLGGTSESDFEAIAKAYGAHKFVLTPGSSPKFRFFALEMSEKLGFELVTLIHPSTILGTNTIVGRGTLIFGGVHIGSDTRIGAGCYISSNSTIEHHNVIGDAFCTGPNFSTSGCVRLGNRVRAGISVSLEPNLDVGDDVLIASGQIITRSISSGQVVKSKKN